MFSLVSHGSFKNTEDFLAKLKRVDILKIMEANGKIGVDALSSATKVDTGLAAASWSYRVSHSGGNYTLAWFNSDVENGFPVILMLQYGHGTRGGGWVEGRDFINPAMRPIFDRISQEVWKAVTSA